MKKHTHTILGLGFVLAACLLTERLVELASVTSPYSVPNVSLLSPLD